MATRGHVGYTLEGESYGAYNHFDSYPTGLGHDLIMSLGKSGLSIVELRTLAENVRHVDDNDELRQSDIDRWAGDPHISTSGGSYYYALRELQGSLLRYLRHGVFPLSPNFSNNRHEVWAYLVNFDSGMLEVYYFGEIVAVFELATLIEVTPEMLEELERRVAEED